MANIESPPTPAAGDDNLSDAPEYVDFVYRIEGDNQLELNELLPILTGLGGLIQEGNRVVNPDTPDLSISVKPFEAGSFEIELILAPGAVGTLLAFIQSGGTQKIILFSAVERVQEVARRPRGAGSE